MSSMIHRGIRSKEGQKRRQKKNKAFKRYRDRQNAETIWLDDDKEVKAFNGVVIKGVDYSDYSFLETGEVLNDNRSRGSQFKRDLIVAFLKNSGGAFQT